jgi:hypothetical protein
LNKATRSAGRKASRPPAKKLLKPRRLVSFVPITHGRACKLTFEPMTLPEVTVEAKKSRPKAKAKSGKAPAQPASTQASTA